MNFKAAILIIALFLGGCSTYMAPQYSVSISNVHKMKTDFKVIKSSVQVNEFTKASKIPDTLMCRGAGPVTPSSGKSYQKYIHDALTDELILADIYNENGKVILDGRLDELDFDSMSGTWKSKLFLNSSNGRSLTVYDEANFGTSFDGNAACQNVANAFPSAIQSLLTKVISNENFKELLLPSPAAAKASP